MATPEQNARRSAQRRLAGEIHTGRYKPSGIGAKARRVANARLQELRDIAFYNTDRRLGHYVKYKRATVEANVYGGETAESGPVPGMDFGQAEWTGNADAEELRSRAEPYYLGNPWWYH
jgi:hypothetical protein